MKKIRIYLDTSVINFLFADDAPEARMTTNELFENYIKPGVYDAYISPIVIDEINRTPDVEKRRMLLKAIRDYDVKVLDIEAYREEIEKLAVSYIDHGVIPRKKLEDALHVAISTVEEMDALISWNYKHLANIFKERRIISVNLSEGYIRSLKICTPMEVIYENEN
jgi:hypothetical protein